MDRLDNDSRTTWSLSSADALLCDVLHGDVPLRDEDETRIDVACCSWWPRQGLFHDLSGRLMELRLLSSVWIKSEVVQCDQLIDAARFDCCSEGL